MKIRLTAVSLLLIICLASSAVFSQSEILEKGESAVSILGSYAQRGQESISGAAAAASILSIFDIGFSYASIDRGSKATGAFAQLHLIREYMMSGEFPLNLTLFGQITNVESLTSKTFGVSLYKKLGNSSRTLVIPAISFSTTSYEGGRDNSEAIDLGLTVSGRVGQVAIMHVTTSYTAVERKDILGITAGLTFAFGKKSVQKESF